MSVSYQVYVGPYIQVHNPAKPSFKEYHGCSNHKCRNHQKETAAKFCDDCGTKITLLKVPTKEPLRFDVYDKTGGKLTEICREFLPDPMKEYKFIVPNTGKIGIWLEAYDSQVIELSQTVMNETLAAFLRESMKEVCQIKDFFGEEKAVVKWGIISYSS